MTPATGVAPSSVAPVPPRALVLAVLALLVPVSGALLFPEVLGEFVDVLFR